MVTVIPLHSTRHSSRWRGKQQHFSTAGAEIEVKRLFKHNLSNSAVGVGRGRGVGRLLTEAQWSAAQRGVRSSAIPSALG